ncbi:MAG: hypothetical protein O7B26_00310 [Planctomycetota bacterium]|nr:hypothetical protein [Planctomycetota bacterium]
MTVFLAEIGKFVGTKVASAIIFLAVVAGGIWTWQNWDTVVAIGGVLKRVLIWIVLVGGLPWSSYLFMGPLLQFQSRLQTANIAGMVSVAIIGVFCAIDILLAFWLADWGFTGGFTWFVVMLGFVAAGAYNFVICESLARHVETS